MRGLLNLPWAMTLGAITMQYLTLAFPANQPGTGNDAIIAMSNSPLVNSTNAFSGAASTYSSFLALHQLPTSFPPGIRPPEDITFYTVSDSVPPVSIKFQNIDRSRGAPWRPEPGRDETAVRKLLADLVREYSDPTEIGQKLLDPHYEWEQGPKPDAYIAMEPEAPHKYTPQDLWLTGKDWSSACRGFKDFLDAYPGLGIYFELYVMYEPGQEFFAASGVLSEEQARQQRVDVT